MTYNQRDYLSLHAWWRNDPTKPRLCKVPLPLSLETRLPKHEPLGNKPHLNYSKNNKRQFPGLRKRSGFWEARGNVDVEKPILPFDCSGGYTTIHTVKLQNDKLERIDFTACTSTPYFYNRNNEHSTKNLKTHAALLILEKHWLHCPETPFLTCQTGKRPQSMTAYPIGQPVERWYTHIRLMRT